MVLGLFLTIAGAAWAADPTPVPSSSPVPVTKEAASVMLREFQRAQYGEAKAADHQQRLELRNLKASQDARKREWEAKALAERKQFRKDNPKGGASTREFIRDQRSRGIALRAILKDEYSQRVREHEVHRQSMKEDQTIKLKEFRDYLARSERPPENLWPATGH